ncbi:MAG: transcriptional regulator [Alphaproteobacteria bacterium]|nr:transcriptional regulator [Alphaproteobacteria bacterium]
MARKAQIIPPQTDLKRRAVNSKVGFAINPTPEDLKKIEAVVHKSTDKFITQAADKLKRLREGYRAATPNKSLRPAFLKQVREESLSIKGLGGMFNFPLMTAIAKSLNDFTQGRSDVDDKQMSLVSLHIDALYVVLAQRIEGEGSMQESQVLDAFQEAVAKIG